LKSNQNSIYNFLHIQKLMAIAQEKCNKNDFISKPITRSKVE
jgi:hypothetical protein